MTTLTAEEARQRLGIAERTIRNVVTMRQLHPVERTGPILAMRFTEAEVERYLAARNDAYRRSGRGVMQLGGHSNAIN
jgi:predicted DNA-binding transcriptional regulator AlpA